MKAFIQLTTALVLALMAVLSFTFAPISDAETVPQMRLRLFVEAQQRHPDVWNGCEITCVQARVQSAPFLEGLAKQANVNISDLARYAVVRSYEWGIGFEKLYGRPPTEYDWGYGYSDNAEALRYELAASPVIYITNEWATRHFWKIKREYGGAY